ncbi:hypothetical protein Misp01_01360 [Microtetraspora sp. NBRC 13810]|uniref:hypothetical protein n=1 Tax=Microtetraspora sp. NBRC 13810 TaxID=3030990 RepID=UPI0024A31E04|nr:hypothetical protein [Microtetraspora sp. NBRC 13810]GLW05006.1 hypothetical protein Misp01_01360 [Microtetraspora sp. NBRC 13810]
MAETNSQPLAFNSGPLMTDALPTTMFTNNLEQIKKWLDNASPDTVRRAGQYYVAAHDLLYRTSAELKAKATELAEHLGGPVGVTTQRQLQALDASMRELADKMRDVGVPLQKYADNLAWGQRNLVEKRFEDSRSDHDTDWADWTPFWGMYRAEKRATDHFEKVNDEIVRIYAELPTEVQSALPTPVEMPMPDYRSPGLPDFGAPPAASGTGLPGDGSDAWDRSDFANAGDPSASGPGSLDPDGLNPGGLNPGGLDPDGLNPGGLDPDGLNPGGQDPNGLDPNGPNPGGLNPGGLDPNGLNPGGLNPGGLDANGTSLPGMSGKGVDDTALAGLNDANALPASGIRGADFNPAASGYGGSPYGGSGYGSTGYASPGVLGSGGGGAGGGVSSGGVLRAADAAAAAARGASGMGVAPSYLAGAPATAGGHEEQHEEHNSTLLEDDDVWGGGGDHIPSIISSQTAKRRSDA